MSGFPGQALRFGGNLQLSELLLLPKKHIRCHSAPMSFEFTESNGGAILGFICLAQWG